MDPEQIRVAALDRALAWVKEVGGSAADVLEIAADFEKYILDGADTSK
ncbi:hypothetical protein [Zhihengliuella halotolerans]|nr:hypothetical protein [Zhihengliuella halotolerans]